MHTNVFYFDGNVTSRFLEMPSSPIFPSHTGVPGSLNTISQFPGLELID